MTTTDERKFRGRKEGDRFITGRGEYTGDFDPPGQPHAGFRRAAKTPGVSCASHWRYFGVKGMKPRSALASFATALLIASAPWPVSPALGQDESSYPTKPVRMIVPFAPGGAPDTIARALGQRLSEDLAQPFVVDNRAGAGGALAADAMVKSAPDGYTLCICDSTQWAILPALRKELPFNPARDFQAVSMLAKAANFLFVHSNLKVNNLGELISMAKANPGKLNYGTPGIGSIHHLTVESLKARAGIQIEHVPYKGAGEVVPAMLSGQITLALQALPAIAGQVKQGNFRILAVALAQRSDLAPEVPTFAELGIDGMDFPGSFAVIVPAATPAPVVRRLSAAVNVALKHPSTVERLRTFAMVPTPTTPEAAAAELKQDLEKFDQAAQLAGLKR